MQDLELSSDSHVLNTEVLVPEHVAQTGESQASLPWSCSGTWKLKTLPQSWSFTDFKIPVLAVGVWLVGCSVVVLQGLIWTLHWWQSFTLKELTLLI